MAEKTTQPTEKAPATAPAEQTATPAPEQDATAEAAQAQVDKEQEQGYRGIKTDQTPDAAYTVQGVTSNPEQAANAAHDADAAARKGGEQA